MPVSAPVFSERYLAAEKWSACGWVSRIHSTVRPFSCTKSRRMSALRVAVAPDFSSKSSTGSMMALRPVLGSDDVLDTACSALVEAFDIGFSQDCLLHGCLFII